MVAEIVESENCMAQLKKGDKYYLSNLDRVEVYYYTHVKRNGKRVRVKKKAVDVSYMFQPIEVFVNGKMIYKTEELVAVAV